MLERIRGWYAPPQFANNLDKTRRAALLNAILLADIALLVFGVTLNLIFRVPWAVTIIELLTIGILSLMRRVLFLGRVSLVAMVSLLFFSVMLAFALGALGTIHSPLIGSAFLIMLMGGMLLNPRQLSVVVVVNVMLTVLLALLESKGLLPPAEPTITISQWIAALFILIYAAGLTYWTHNDIQKALTQAREELSERQRVQSALRRSSDFLQGIVNAINDPLMVKDSSHRFIIANDPACAILHRVREDLIGRVDADFLPTEVADIYWEQDEHILATGETVEYEETIYPLIPGQTMVISTKKTRYVDPQTGDHFVVAIIRDITRGKQAESELERARDDLEKQVEERTAALTDINTALMTEISERRIIEEALRASQREIEVLMNTVPGLVVMFRADGQLIHWNTNYEQTLGYSPEELRSMHGELTVTPADRPLLAQAIEQVMREGHASMELRVLTNDGREIPTFSTGALVIGEDGTQYVASIGLDISRVKATEEALRSSKRELEVLMNTAAGIVYMFREDGHIIRWNRQFEELSGFTADELIRHSVWDLIDSNQHEALLPKLHELLDHGQVTAELNIITRAGRSIPILATGGLIVSESGERLIAGTGIDISGLKAAEAALSRSQGQLRALLDATSDAAFLMDTDGNFLAVNQAMAREMEVSPEALIGIDGFEQLPPDLRTSRWENFERVLRTGEPARFEDMGMNGWSDNSFFPVFDSFGKVVAVASYSRDVTDQKRAMVALRESEERYALAARGANDGLWDADLFWDENSGEFSPRDVYFSPRMRAMLGWTETGPLGDLFEKLVDVVNPEDRVRVLAHLDDHLEGRVEHFETEFRVLHSDSTYRWMLVRGLAVRNDRGNPYRIAGSMTDITDRKRVEAQLLYDAFHDSLTGLPNRALLTDRLEQVLRHRKRYPDEHFAVLYMDLDRFKDINDSLGHSIGDQLLIAAAQRILGCLRMTDTLARLGGDEFVILLPEVREPADATTVVERILEQMHQPFALNGIQVVTSGSIGIVFADESHDRPEKILRDADIAMYRAKALGRARYQVFDASMHSQVLSRLRLEADLRLALERNEFEVYYMPIRSLQDGSFSGYEALVRWRNPERGLVAPGEFIPLAEESGLIIPLDRWVLIAACRQILAWQREFGQNIVLNINLSSKQFSQSDLIEHIQSALQETGFPPACLTLEITESAIMENIELATLMLHQVQALGVKVEVDDFGTGYSSLTYLLQLPVNGLKIDRSFIHYLGVDLRRTEIVRTIITLAHNIGMTVVAEGIETEVQRAGLAEMSCDYGQGYFLSKPLDSESATVYARAAVSRP